MKKPLRWTMGIALVCGGLCLWVAARPFFNGQPTARNGNDAQSTGPTLPKSEAKPKDLWTESEARISLSNLQGRIEDAEKGAIRFLSSDDFEKQPHAALYAIRFLGYIRSVEARPILCKRLLYKQEIEQSDDLMGDEFHYPAVAALIRIGIPSIWTLLHHVTQRETMPEYRIVAMDLMRKVGGARVLRTLIQNHKIVVNMKPEEKKRLETFEAEFEARYKDWKHD